MLEEGRAITGKSIQIHYADGWAALYLDGRLVERSVGDSYLTEEQAFALLGVTVVQDDAWLRGQNGLKGVAQTLEEVAEYKAQREARQAEAAKLRAQATEMLAKAGELEREV